MKSIIRQWNPDAGTYGNVLLTLYAPLGDDAELALWEITTHVMGFMAGPVAAFYDDEPVATHHVSNYVRRIA